MPFILENVNSGSSDVEIKNREARELSSGDFLEILKSWNEEVSLIKVT